MRSMDSPIDKAELPTGRLMALSSLVSRVLAPNPSAFTFTGTQSYVVGGAQDVAVIDPGPDEQDHLDALVAAIGARRVVAIMCTHTHRDHSPAAAPLSLRTGAPVIGCAPLTLEDDGPRADAAFDAGYRPDDILSDGQMVQGRGWTLEAVATPGHTSNHLCFALHEEKALFTGDHIMGWSTTIVSPPDGNMADYMRSMQRLVEREDAVYYPAHGEPVANPQQWARGMLGHRKQREAQILRQIRQEQHRGATIAELVATMYKGVDTRLHPAAARSVLAHLLDLAERGIVRLAGDERWEAVAA
jgi:glyoxylase-like metal-dependent hydrolase (beta-lactamase superfamily II)